MNDNTERARASMASLWLLLGERSGGRAESRDGVTLMATGLPFAPCNQAIIDHADDPERAVTGVLDFYSSPPLPFLLQIWHEAGAIDAARVAGLVQAVRLPLMISDRVAVEPIAIGPVSIRSATAEDLPAAVTAASECFELDPVAMAIFLGEWMLSEPSVGIFVATHDAEIVGTSIGVTSEQVVGIFNVATVPRYRRRGIGEALTAAAIAHGVEQGARAAYLQASVMGRPVYERMGFTEVGHHMGYMKR